MYLLPMGNNIKIYDPPHLKCIAFYCTSLSYFGSQNTADHTHIHYKKQRKENKSTKCYMVWDSNEMHQACCTDEERMRCTVMAGNICMK